MAGEKETGVTTFFLQEEVDTGNVILKRTMPIGPDETAGDVHDRMMYLGADAVLETIRRIEAGTAEAQPQDDQLATPAPKLFKADARIPWSTSATDVHNHVRGLAPYPGAWTEHAGTLLKIYQTRPAEGSGPPGAVLEADVRLVVACGEGAVEVLEVQQEGKRRMAAEDFLCGYELAGGEQLA